jgi:uncharacterized membrane protein
LLAGGLAAGGGGAALLFGRRVMSDGRTQTDGQPTDRWHAVTVYRSPEQVVAGGQLPQPLAELGDRVEVQVRPAPGNRGTEIHGRVRARVPTGVAETVARLAGTDPRQPLRAALRDTKMLLETGEILQPDRPPTARRTLRNLPLQLAIRRARSEGRL